MRTIEDCSTVLERVPTHSKAMFRRGQAYLALKVRSPAAILLHSTECNV